VFMFQSQRTRPRPFVRARPAKHAAQPAAPAKQAAPPAPTAADLIQSALDALASDPPDVETAVGNLNEALATLAPAPVASQDVQACIDDLIASGKNRTVAEQMCAPLSAPDAVPAAARRKGGCGCTQPAAATHTQSDKLELPAWDWEGWAKEQARR
jgi:hypothetical protein